VALVRAPDRLLGSRYHQFARSAGWTGWLVFSRDEVYSDISWPGEAHLKTQSSNIKCNI
jgi:hypothetical protein